MSIQSINDEWWVYLIMDPHYSNNIFVNGTTHETGHKQPKFVSSENAHYTIRIFPPAIDIIPTLLVVVYSNGKYTN